MNKALVTAREKSQHALEIREIAQRLGWDMACFPPVGWRELDAERGESRLENWQTYVEATADIAL